MDARAVLVGRDAERASLDEAVRLSAAGSPAAVLVSGESGIGKTRLVTEVTTGFEQQGGRAFWGRCLRFGAAESPYHPIGQIASEPLAKLVLGDDHEARGHEPSTQLSPSAVHSSPLVSTSRSWAFG